MGGAINQLRCLPGHLSNSPWSVHSTPRYLVYPSTKNDFSDRVYTASSVTTDDEWVTYAWDGKNWQQIACAPDDQTVILVCALLNDKKRKEREIATLRMDNQNLVMQNTHLRSQVPQCARRSWVSVFLLVLALLASLFMNVNSLETTSYTNAPDREKIIKLNEDLDAFIQEALKKNFTKQVSETVSVVYTTKGYGWQHRIQEELSTWYQERVEGILNINNAVIFLCRSLLPWAWEFSALILAGIVIYRSSKKILDLMFLVAAALTRARFSMIVVAPLQTPYSALVACAVAPLYYCDPVSAIVLLSFHFFSFSLIGMFLSDIEYVKHLRGHFTVLVVLMLHWLIDILGLPAGLVPTLCFCWRLIHLLTMLPPNVIELRDASGKVINKVTSFDGPLFKFAQAFKNRFKQLRNVTVPLVRVNPATVCHISTPDGSKGTGFFCANYVVTAAHVMGNHKVATVTYQGKNYQVNVKKTSEKDMIFLEIPPVLQNAPRLKISRKYNCDWVCLCAPSGDGAFLTAVVEGRAHADTFSYACPTRDGMSGAPLLDVDGHVLGIHQTNTGYTGGAIRLEHSDVVDPPKENSQVAALKKQIEELQAQLNQKDEPKPQRPPRARDLKQCDLETSDIVNLVRVAMQREMQILRDELNQKKKGKNKHGRGRKHAGGIVRRRKIGPMFTEEEYQEMLDEGLDPEQIRQMAEELYDMQAGFPEWSDPEDDDEEVNEWWFSGDHSGNVGEDEEDVYGYYQKAKKPLKDYLEKEWTQESLDEMKQSLSPAERKTVGQVVDKIDKTKNPVEKTVLVALMDRALACQGLPVLSSGLDYQQRVRAAKNGKGGPHGPQKPTSARGKQKQ
ncbi:MAG: ORF1a [Sichuan mamastrovirus 12]|nr:MAG: ORF1a [Sichuan mamastrovirus 12]